MYTEARYDFRVSYPALPKGRHSLTRDEVRAAQRDKLLRGMAEVVAEQGYVPTSVADVLRRAHVSRETFYQQFANKEECFLATLDQCAQTVLDLVAGSVGDGDTALARFDRGLAVYLATLAEQWPVTRTFFVECYAAGAAATQRRFAAQERFAHVLAANFADAPAWQRLPDKRFAALSLAAALSSLVTAAVAANEPARVIALHRPVMELVRHLFGP